MKFPDAAMMILRPTSTDPVNEIFWTSGCSVSAAPVPGPPVSRLKTPAGSPASSINSPSRIAVSGVCSAGLRITVLPHASAGATFQVAIANGKFHGVINAHTPTGSRRVYWKTRGTVAGGSVAPSSFVAQPA